MARSSSWFLLVMVGAVGVLLSRESRQPASPVAGIDRAFLDWLGANAAPARPTPGLPGVTLVEIDDSIADTPNRLPLTPLEYASFLHSVARYEPAVVALAPVPDFGLSPAGAEQLLLDESLAIPKLLLAVRLGSSAGSGVDPAVLPGVEEVRGNRARLAGFPEIVEAPDGRLLAQATAIGATNLPGTEGVPVRDLPLLFSCRERVVPGFTLELLTLALKLAPSEVSVTLGSHVQLGDRLRLPADSAGRALLDLRAFDRINRLSLDDLPLLGANQATPEARAAAVRMRGAVVILGRTDRAARTLRMPGGRAISPAEVFAWAAASLEDAPSTRRASPWWDAGIVAVFAVLGVRLLGRGMLSTVTLAASALIAYALAALAVFEVMRVWLPCALPVGLALLVCGLNALRFGEGGAPVEGGTRPAG